MDRGRTRFAGQGNVFKGSQLVASVLERYPSHLKDRKAALHFCRQLFSEGTIRGVFGSDRFEDSVLLYTWNDKQDPQNKPANNRMTSQSYMKSRGGYGISSADTRVTKRDLYQQGNIKPAPEQTPPRHFNNYPQTNLPPDSYFVGNVHFQQTPESDGHTRKTVNQFHQNSPNFKRASTASRSSESSVEITSRSYSRTRDKNHITNKQPLGFPAMTLPHDHDVIPEEVTEDHHVPLMERTGTSTEYDGSSSIPRSCTTDVSNYNDMDHSAHQRAWVDCQNSYSDNEKQLIEQMKRMKKEHSHILRTYEDRINKLMNKMHELRNIAQMLENSSTKSSPYGMLQSKPSAFNSSGSRPDQSERRPGGVYYGSDGEHPPPLPPRPGRGSRPSPNKPLVTPGTKMKTLNWTRIILRDKSSDQDSSTIWHTMQEPAVDGEEVERLFSSPDVSDTDGATLYDDLIIRRGRSRQQLVSIYDSDRSKRIVICMKCLRATLTDVVSTVSSLDISQINHEGLAELFEFLGSSTHIEKTLHYVRKKGAGQLDHPEYLVFELSKVDHFTDRIEFMRFRYKTQWHLFEIEQQLRELNTACNELTTSISLKNLIETLLAVGNYLNGSTEFGQADGFALDVLNRLKETQERDGKATLLEFVLKTYCQVYESEVDIGCPTRFRLPEPSNMRHAAQVSFEGLQDTLSNLLSDLRTVRENLLDQKARKDAIRPTDSFRVTAENFFAAALEVIGAQEKVLQDVRDLFLRTVKFFQVENTDVTPQQFFHIFAVFLHDCKYFWKLAHRRLAKERFELEFKFKGQLSAVDLHGYGSFRAGVVEGIHSSRLTDPKTSTLTRDEKAAKAGQGKSPVVPPKPSNADLRKPGYSSDHLDHSPKPLTSAPPSSEKVYKPLPKTPHSVANHAAISAPLQSPNYENQSDLTKYYPDLPVQSEGHGNPYPQYPGINDVSNHEPDNKGQSKDKKGQQFSLKAWLKREREQVKREIENEHPNENSASHKKPNTSSRSFSRLKNSMMQKLSGGNSSKRDVNSNETKPAKDKRVPDHSEPVTERFESSVQTNQFGSPRGYYPTQPSQPTHYNAAKNRYLGGQDYDYQLSNPDVVISPIEDLEQEEVQAVPEVPAAPPGVPNTARSNPDDTPRFGVVEDRSEHKHKQRNTPDEQRPGILSPQFHTPTKLSHVTPNVHRNDSITPSTVKAMNNYENQQFAFQSPSAKTRETIDDTNNNVTNAESLQFLPQSGRNGYIQNNRYLQQAGQPPYLYEKRSTPNKHGVAMVPDNESLTTTPPVKPVRVDNERFLTPGTREPMHIKSIGSLTDKFNPNNDDESMIQLEPIEESSDIRRGRDTNSSKSTSNRGETPDFSPPLPPRTYSKNEDFKKTRRDVKNNNVVQDQTDNLSAYDRLQNLTMAANTNQVNQFSSPQTHVSQFSSPQPYSRQTRSDSNIRDGRNEQTPTTRHVKYPTPYSNPGPHHLQQQQQQQQQQHQHQNGVGENNRFWDSEHQNKYGAPKIQNEVEDKDEGYRAQLRRAANINPSAFTGYGSLKPTLPYTGRASMGPTYSSPSYQSPASTAVVKPTVLNSHEVSYMAF